MSRSSLLAAALLVLLSPAAARAVDCARAEVVCVPEESTLEDAFLDVVHGGTIDIAAGVYPSPASDLGFRLGGQPGGARRDRSFTVRARSGPGTVTLTGQGARRIVVIDRLGAGRWITFEGLRFVNGRSGTVNVGGAVTLKDARATFVDCEFSGNRATGSGNGGAGLGLYGRAQALVLRSLFENNRSIRDGAAIFSQMGGAPYDGPNDLWIWSSTFRNNCETGNLSGCSGGDGTAGAILVRNSSLWVADSTFEDNLAGWVGGAILAYGSFGPTSPFCNYANPATDVYVVRSRFVGNTISGTPTPSFGGAIHLEDCTRVRFQGTLFEDNDADQGGAVSTFRSRLEVRQSVFRNNGTAASGSETNVLGGALLGMSSDGSTAPPDYPATSIVVSRTLFDGGPAGTVDSQHGGCLTAVGDVPRSLAGTCDSSDSTLCAQLTVLDSAFFDCDVGALGGTFLPPGGGALSLTRAFADLSGVILARNDAGGSNARGGGLEVLNQTRVEIADSVHSGNSATGQGPDSFVSPDSTIVESGVAHWSATQGGPADGELLAAPSVRYAGSSPFGGESWLTYAWRGTSATLDGNPLPSNPHNGVQGAGVSTHSLLVDGSVQRLATVSAATTPTTQLSAASSCPAGGSTSLSWSTSGGTFVGSVIDQGVGGGTPSGSTAVGPAGTVTYRRLAILHTGAAFDEVTVYVGECPVIFSDGFESGDTSAWSSAVP